MRSVIIPLLLAAAAQAAGISASRPDGQQQSYNEHETRKMQERDPPNLKSIQESNIGRSNLHYRTTTRGPTTNQPNYSSSSTYSTTTRPLIVPSAPPRPSFTYNNPPTNSSSPSNLPTATGTAPSAPAKNMTSVSCANLCSNLTFAIDYPVAPVSCQSYSAGSSISVTGGQSTANCGSSFATSVGLCRVVLTVTTSPSSETYMEVWMPSDSATSWNGRSMNTDNGGLNGCVAFDDMQYVTGMGFAAIGDNGGHNSSAFDGSWMTNKEEIADWAGRARHASAEAGKSVINQFYGRPANYSYYIGCSTGGAQGMHSAQHYPNDFNGIIAGAAAADYQHLQDWSSRFIQLTGTSSDPRFLTLDEWIYVQSHILDQCDAKIDGVNDGILEDPTLCQFDYTTVACSNNQTSGCLTDTQTNTVREVFTALYNTEGQLLFPALLYGSQVDAYRLGQLSGTVQGIANDWWRYGVHNDSNFDSRNVGQSDYALADSLDSPYGNPSSFSGDISAFRNAGNKMLIYHGLSDPLVSGTNSQRYYLKVAQNLGISSNTDLDPFLRVFRISGMAHCGLGGIAGAGAWMFGQNALADVDGVVDNVIDDMVSWVENGQAPDVLTGTKFFDDQPSAGLQYIRPHCRFPYRTTYNGGDSTRASGWNCTLIENWRDCGVGAEPRLCNTDGSFAP